MQRSYVIGFLGVVTVAVILAVILNYFNIISFSKILPGFNFFPKSNQGSTFQTNPQKPFSCPVEAEPCPEAEFIEKAQNVSKSTPEGYMGIGFNSLAPGTEVTAVFSGKYRFRKVGQDDSSSDGQELINFNIQNQDYEVSYLITGKVSDLPEKGEVTQDQPIATLSGGQRGQNNFGKLYNMIVAIKDLKTGQYLRIKPIDDSLSVE